MSQKQQWIEPEHPIFSVREQAVLLELNRSNIYYKRRPKIFSEEQLALLWLVDEIYTQYPFFGTRQMSAYISAYHYSCGRYPVRWAYQHLGLHSVAPGPLLVKDIQNIKFTLIY